MRSATPHSTRFPLAQGRRRTRQFMAGEGGTGPLAPRLVNRRYEERKLPPMLKVINRNAIIPVWLLVFGLIVLSRSPMPVATTLLLLIVGLAVPAIILILWKEPSRTVAEVLHHAHSSRTEP